MTHQGPHDKWHWNCCGKPVLAKLLWWFGFLSLLGGLLAYWQGGQFLNISVPTWYWNALVGGVLAISLKISKWHSCWHEKHG